MLLYLPIVSIIALHSVARSSPSGATSRLATFRIRTRSSGSCYTLVSPLSRTCFVSSRSRAEAIAAGDRQSELAV